MLPQYIEKKIKRLTRYLNTAYLIKRDIEKWAEKKGINIYGPEWHDTAVDECSAVKGISAEGLSTLLEAIEKTRKEAGT